MYKKIIILLLCTINIINVNAEKEITQQQENSEIIRAFLAYEKAKKAVNILGDETHHEIKDIENTLKQINKVNTFKIQERNNPNYLIQDKLIISLNVAYVLKCESLLGDNFLHKEMSHPILRYPPSVKYSKTKSGDVIDPECLKKTEVLKAYTKVRKDYEQKRKTYFWNQKLEKVIQYRKKILFFHLKYASRKEAASRIPLIILSINDKDKRKEWLKELLKIISRQ